MLTAPVTTSKKLLKDLRDIIGRYPDARERLQQVVKAIATGMVVEVCSVYIKRPGDLLELFATQGLNPSAINKTRLRIGEGLVGLVASTAQPVVAANAWEHPNFAYRPETEEENFKSFCGVPLLLGGRVVGVLVVQNIKQRHYNDDDIEQLETIAILLGYLITSGDLIKPEEQVGSDGIGLMPTRLTGLRIHSGLAIGRAFLYNAAPRITRMMSDNTDEELARLQKALDEMHVSISGMIEDAANDMPVAAGQEHVEVLESYRLFASDKGWLNRIRESIRTGLSAEASVQKVHNETRARMNLINDPYIRARLSDLEDITARLLQHILGEETLMARHIADQDFIVIARDLGPAALLDFDRKRLRGVVLEEGSQTAHVAVVARALDIPVVGKIGDALRRIESGDSLIIDGEGAEIYIRPGEEVIQSFRENIVLREKRKAQYAAARNLPAITADGVPVSLLMNAGLPIDIDQLDATNADGIGLFRTEISFMTYGQVPGLAEQTEFYKQMIDAAGYRHIVFRTIDVGGDKPLPNMPHHAEENPAMGWRGLRLALDMPSLLRQQLRAMLRASKGKRLQLMFPMVAEIAEFDAAKNLLDMEVRRFKERGEDLPSQIAVGAMLEVPALLWQLPALLKRVDFLSIGSNDLIQFLFASDRGGARTSLRYDALSPPVLRVIRNLVEECDKAGVPLTLCGEMAARPLEAMALVSLGLNRLSMSASSIGPIKATIRQLNVAQLRAYILSLLDSTEHSIRGKLKAFVADRGILIQD
ncbi:MAG: phosphoenolpyruvate--protein phosphotransferase [Alphaproteobacteria bacterium]|nr:MAG: phosphoenolpyruvate--protein phosphotransferase [Alphaproteobacteria bacterium]